MTIGERLKQIREFKYPKQGDFSQFLGINQQSLSNYELNKRNIPDEIKIKLQQSGVNINWLLTGYGEMFLSETAADPDSKDSTAIQYAIKKIVPNIILVDLYNVEASAGNGREVAEYYDVSQIPILEEFIFPYKANQIKALIVKGDSMINARIFNNDIVFFSPEEKTGNGIFVISIGNEVFVKRIEFNPIDKLVRIISENEKYQPITVKAVDSDTLRINGRVIAVLHREL